MLFYQCKQCGKIAAETAFFCCGRGMELLCPQTQPDAEHLPLVFTEGKHVSVYIGSEVHAMEREHSVLWICLETLQGGQWKRPDTIPQATFLLTNDDAPLAAYSFCSQHGLWETRLQEEKTNN